jgi:hypothetical protein
MSRDKRGVVNPVVPGSSPGATAKFVICWNVESFEAAEDEVACEDER